MQNYHRIPPQDLEAESSVIGGAMVNQDCAFYAVSFLSESDFYRPAHQTIFSAIKRLHAKNDSIDIVSVSNELKMTNDLDSVGGPSYLSSLTDIFPSKVMTKSHAKIIKHKADLRRAIKVANEIEDKCYCDEGTPANLMVEELEKVIYDSSVHRKDDGFKHISEILPGVVSRLEKLSTGEIKSLGISTGYRKIDLITNGLKPEYYIIAGRPSMGKTSLAMNIIENQAAQGFNQAIFSLEMSNESLALRAISSQSGVDSFRLSSGKISDSDWPKIHYAAEKLSNSGIFVDDVAGLSPFEIRSRARRIKEKHDIKAFWVDYLQMSKTKARSKEEETSIISSELKNMSKELKVPVVALSQLSRKCEERADRKPMLSDLRDSGTIEQDADVVMFIYRDEVYNKSPDNPKKGIAEIIISKNRNGPTGTVELLWEGGCTRFKNIITMHEAV